ncbi:archaetidylserine decarboxylase [Archaeoglobus fulgidus]|uniref:Putative archaetidylserine decarboxylase proenzyme n=1 Tax=Archaeoglobus fulgidus (strain ATCC 49558 / DSM 4304 / JCM 9628 / NBRC 100126 / VC-16) TaxID=224325 RepID=ASD_ARCFU|nr:archaetidylserine decarboxylase [Archaeoglobus fulgidus]O28234.1 RecName: Full=Putative archaetidylserine decarboxylase proenzyme; Contains: RecName: Full=Archaetidylserine decarboxylase alpha chain; Contains: RecName: Full=Archaetidylserine decarboxylase beta chain [Archaeoglobus fulgidus DSM 4304]AAB89201.1 phosphatidylserine decarboxylase (psd2) [Archaeoglobus fulgidus DSM 4304]
MIERSGYGIIAASLLLSAVAYLLHPLISALFVGFALFTAYFFRDPERKIGEGVVSPADGRIDYLEGRRLEIFMSPFDCHINRAPWGGKVLSVKFIEGSTPPAFIRKSGVRTNEILIETEHGVFRVLQMAGIFARRIVSYVSEGDVVKKGQKIGMIRFGSRVVLEVPEGFRFVRGVGEKVKAGETVALRDESFQGS